ncbi:MAG: M23 family metallopeptidase, partial [Actinomycetota bacterium]|nr:M23 family metallopeptidase [Actinomycetota bacterium]
MFSRLTTAVLALALGGLVASPAAHGWSWPVSGAVLRGFDFGGGPYTAEGHRGLDVAAVSGAPVLAPAGGQVAFAGSVGANGRTLSLRTADGWVVTLTHLGSIAVAVGEGVAEGEAVATVGPSGEAEHDRPYVHLGIRRADDPRGYVDPLTLLPAQAGPAPPPAPPEPVAEARAAT